MVVVIFLELSLIKVVRPISLSEKVLVRSFFNQVVVLVSPSPPKRMTLISSPLGPVLDWEAGSSPSGATIVVLVEIVACVNSFGCAYTATEPVRKKRVIIFFIFDLFEAKFTN